MNYVKPAARTPYWLRDDVYGGQWGFVGCRRGHGQVFSPSDADEVVDAPQPGLRRLSRRTVLSLVGAGYCPFCDAGPFDSPTLHIKQVHGVSSHALRDCYGISWNHKLTSERMQERLSLRTARWMSDPRYRLRLDAQLRTAWKTRLSRPVDYHPAQARDKRRRGPELTCAQCGRRFYSSPSKGAKYCGRTCYHRAQQSRGVALAS